MLQWPEESGCKAAGAAPCRPGVHTGLAQLPRPGCGPLGGAEAPLAGGYDISHGETTATAAEARPAAQLQEVPLFVLSFELLACS